MEDLAALIAVAGGSAMVFGDSSGAVLALEAAARRHAITRLAVFEAPFTSFTETAVQEARGYRAQLTTLLQEGRRGDAVVLPMTRFGTPPQAIAGMKQSPAWPLFQAIAPTLAYDGAIMGDGTVPAGRIRSVTVPVLVMDGGASPAFMHQAAEALAGALPNAKRRTLTDQTHAVAPEVLAAELVEFFKG